MKLLSLWGEVKSGTRKDLYLLLLFPFFSLTFFNCACFASCPKIFIQSNTTQTHEQSWRWSRPPTSSSSSLPSWSWARHRRRGTARRRSSRTTCPTASRRNPSTCAWGTPSRTWGLSCRLAFPSLTWGRRSRWRSTTSSSRRGLASASTLSPSFQM